jgi:hypothetical protein
MEAACCYERSVESVLKEEDILETAVVFQLTNGLFKSKAIPVTGLGGL